MKYIQCFGGIGANVVDVSPAFVASATTKFQTYVAYDAVKHAAFQPRDRVSAAGVDSTRRLALESAEVVLFAKNAEYELLKDSGATTPVLDAKLAEVLAAEAAMKSAEGL
jgi:hypothetical protein